MSRRDRRALLAASADAAPMWWMPWLPLQLAYLRCQDTDRLMRAGNQAFGKTTAVLADLAMSAAGLHPYRADGGRKHGEYWVICVSHSQSVVIQKKLHNLLPRKLLHPDTVFSEKRGYRGTNPAVEVLHTDGSYSVIRFKTSRQDSLDLASETLAGALFDEIPYAEEIYAEVLKRVMMSGGWVSLGLTPIGRPAGWLRKRVDDGLITDIHAPMTPEQLIPVGSSIPRQIYNEKDRVWELCDAAWIQRQIDKTPAHEVPVRIHGEWECRTMERYFSTFRSSGPAAHVHQRVPAGEFRLVLGIDHGDRPGKQVAALIAVDESGPRPVFYVLDTYTDLTGSATPADDAQGILGMLARYRWTWKDLDEVWGDRVHLKGKARQKSNRDLSGQIAALLKVPQSDLKPPIKTVKRGEGHGAGSLSVGCRWLYNQITDDRFGVNPRCDLLISALDRWDMRDDDNKDKVDAVRYALDSYIFGRRRDLVRPGLRTA